MRFYKPGIGAPHDLLKLPELTKEAWVAVVYFLGIRAERWVLVLFNIPDTVRKSAATGASDFLLFVGPIRKLYLVREEYTACHQVNKLEFGLDGPDSFLSLCTFRHGFDNFDTE